MHGSFILSGRLIPNRYKFWGGLALKTEKGGEGLMEDHKRAATKHGIEIFHDTAVIRLNQDPITGVVTSVIIQHKGQSRCITAKATILAAGGFEANPQLRSRYLGLGWDLAFVRGTPFNTGDLLEIAMRDVSAKPAGHWAGCHSVAWDANAPSNSGDRGVSNEYTKSGYPLGVMVNTEGKRFVDEGIDFRNFTYAEVIFQPYYASIASCLVFDIFSQFGRAILAQPQGIAFQIYDSRTIPWLRDEEYRDSIVERLHANSISDLASICAQKGLQNAKQFITTLEEYNTTAHSHRAEHPDAKWNPAVKDGLSTQSSKIRLALQKSNWALPIDEPPFLAIKVTAGITFTFGGLTVNPETAGVISAKMGREIPGLYCAGEMLGGLFFGNYPGGSGLTAGAVFGRRAGRAAATFARRGSGSKEAESTRGGLSKM